MKLLDSSEHSDDKLWKLVKQNNHRAFEVIYDRHWSTVYFSVYKVLRDEEASSDITQEIFTQLWIKRNTTTIKSLSSYLYGMARNQVFKHLRNGKVAKFHLERMNHIVSLNVTEETVNFHQLQEIYIASLEELPDRCREVFRLSRNEHLSTKEIATRLHVSPKTVENQITKALKHLREVIQLVNLLTMWLVLNTIN